MIVAITSLRLRSLSGFFSLSWHGLQISRQSKRQHGFLSLKNTGFGYDHYTISAWSTEENMKVFARSGAHLDAMKKSAKLSTTIRTYVYQTDALPGWKEAKHLKSSSLSLKKKKGGCPPLL